MEFLSYGITGELLWEFALFGWAMNLMMIVISFAVTLFKALSFSPQELMEFRMFAMTRHAYIDNYVSSEKRFITLLLHLLPTYSAWLTFVYLFYVLTNSGSQGLIKGIMMADNWELVQTIKYQYVEKNK